MERKVVALEKRLRNCRNVITLGVKTNFADYRPEERRLIVDAPKIFYPSAFYADLLDTMGKKVFPSYHTYKCVQDKIKQTALFNMLDIPHPKTQVFYGRRWLPKVTQSFAYPFIAKIPRGSAMGRGVFLIHSLDQLQDYQRISPIAYIQEYLPTDHDYRVVVIGRQAVHAYTRRAKWGDFRSNVSQGGTIVLGAVPDAVISLALQTAMACQWDDVGIDILEHGGQLFVLEANMKYGKEGFRKAGIDYDQLMVSLIENDKI
jgi:ribosomal protein S6--L-glutamate ligase